jgi:hypothetical protein
MPRPNRTFEERAPDRTLLRLHLNQRSSDFSQNQLHQSADGSFLDSWKEIAVFLKRGVRTVQRWERSEGLPVHRHKHWKRGSVYGLAAEIEAWFKGREGAAESRPVSAIAPVAFKLPDDQLLRACLDARRRAERARGRFETLREIPHNSIRSA